MGASTSEVTGAGPLFIHGIMPRSGTNYLWDLLLLHPACGAGRAPIREDFFLETSDHLAAFVRGVRDRWDPMWGTVAQSDAEALLSSIGEGLVSYLHVDRDRRLVAKTPSVVHLDRFFDLFPGARLIVLVRDGRSVVQSCMATFGWDLDRAARDWASAADTILRFERSGAGDPARYLRVRYEDLLDDLDAELDRILAFAGLDPDAFDREAARDLPVRGSSAYLGAERREIHWEPVPKGPDFDPRRRWASWSPRMIERFAWVAGDQMRALGYPDVVPAADDPVSRARESALDWRWLARTALRRAAYRGRVRLGTATRPLRELLGIARPR